jgi:cysteine/glycine-rich protein
MKQFEDKLYCDNCWKKNGFSQKQVKSGKWVKKESKPNALSSKFGGGGVKCTVCDKSVYAAETVTFEKKPYHAECIKCSTCDKKISASNCNQYEEKLYCGQCFTKGGFAQKQRKVKWTKKEGTSTGGTSKYGGGGTDCNICGKKVYPAELMSFEKKAYHAKCFKCSLEDCGKQKKLSDMATFEGALICRKCFAEKGYSKKQTASTNTAGSSGSADPRFAKFGGGGNKCKVCGKTVYPAETIQYEKMTFHDKCFACNKCGLRLTGPKAEMLKEDSSIWCGKCWKEAGHTN